MHCCETAGFNLVVQNESVEQISLLINVFWMWGMAFIPDKMEPDIDRESDTSTYTGVHCLDIIFKRGIY
jgi:hypothetical protein